MRKVRGHPLRESRAGLGIVVCLLLGLAIACRPAPALDSSRPAGAAAIADAFRTQERGVWVEAEGEVDRVLPDDREGSPHQRFILRLNDGQTVLIAHNLELATRFPVERGQRVAFRGEYEWNPRGGVVHWTHDDPRGRHTGGWLRVSGRTYR